VPITLALGLALAVLLYQNIRAKSLFRVIYFLPYITPFVATSIVFSLLFSHRTGSPANQLIGFLGQEPQRWLLEPKGIFQLLFGDAVPNALAGPGLALCVIILYSVWTYAGYGTVIFLAGLGNIPTDVYESAKIDGANGWQQFRHMTLPLLSPVTFFLLLVSTIGTLQAFTQIYLMRRAGAYTAVDTINIYIYEEITAGRPDYAFGSAMAFVLFGVILVLTLIQNRIAGRRVFYG
jgi:ABC-type sugar transport system permease subunit